MNKKRLRQPGKGVWITVGAVSAVLIAAIVTLGVCKSKGIFLRYTTAASSPHRTVSEAEISALLYMDYYAYLAETTDPDAPRPDPEKPPESQSCPLAEGSWYDYFLERTAEQCKALLPLAEAADAAGTVLTQEDQNSIEQTLTTLREKAQAEGMTPAAYIPAHYGKGVNEAVLRQALELTALAQRQYAVLRDSLEPDEAAIAAYDRAHPQLCCRCVYEQYLLLPAETDTAVEASDRQEQAEALAEAVRQQGFPAALKAGGFAGDATRLTVAYGGSTADQWLFDARRKAGETTVLEQDDGSLAVCRMVRPAYRESYATCTVRLITQTGSDALHKAEALRQQWRENGGDEAAFAALAAAYGEQDAANGGLREHVRKESLDPAVRTWCYDPARRIGDAAAIKTESGAALVYYGGKGLKAWQALLREQIFSEAYRETSQALGTAYPVTLSRFPDPLS